jgi:hypothetical protein
MAIKAAVYGRTIAAAAMPERLRSALRCSAARRRRVPI